MFGRMLRSVAIVTACWFVVEHLGDVARYFNMREMSRLPDEPARPI